MQQLADWLISSTAVCSGATASHKLKVLHVKLSVSGGKKYRVAQHHSPNLVGTVEDAHFSAMRCAMEEYYTCNVHHLGIALVVKAVGIGSEGR